MRLSYNSINLLAEAGDEAAIKAKKMWLAYSIINGVNNGGKFNPAIKLYGEYDRDTKTIVIREERI